MISPPVSESHPGRFCIVLLCLLSLLLLIQLDLVDCISGETPTGNFQNTYHISYRLDTIVDKVFGSGLVFLFLI